MRVLTEILYLFFYFVEIINEICHWFSLRTFAAISDIEPIESTLIASTPETKANVFEKYIIENLTIDL